MKLWEKVVGYRLRKCTSISWNQAGFMPGQSCNTSVGIFEGEEERFAHDFFGLREAL